MTDEQRYIVEGKARDAAKKLRAEVAALRFFFDDYVEKMLRLQGVLKSFLSSPSEKTPDGRILVDHVNAAQRELGHTEFFENTAEFLEKTRRLRELEEQIKNF